MQYKSKLRKRLPEFGVMVTTYRLMLHGRIWWVQNGFLPGCRRRLAGMAGRYPEFRHDSSVYLALPKTFGRVRLSMNGTQVFMNRMA